MNRLPIAATVVVAVAAATLAAVATRDVAVTTGAVSTPMLGWLLPVIIEGGAVTAALLAWRRTTAGVSARPERLALLILMLLAVCVNAAHATGDALLGVVLAACPPIILVVSIELLLRNRAEMTRVSVRRASTERTPVNSRATGERAKVSTPRRPVSTPAASTAPKAVSTPSVDAPSTWATLSRDERAARVQEALATTPDITGAALAAQVGCGASTARRLLAQARDQAAA